MTDFQFPKWTARNPLGIIALFISLIYGMSALLLGTSIASLSQGNQTILVWFIIAFPFVVLGVFGWLVAQHHMKLYGPGDYRTDESFLNAVTVAPPAMLGAQLRFETEEEEEEEAQAQTETGLPMLAKEDGEVSESPDLPSRPIGREQSPERGTADKPQTGGLLKNEPHQSVLARLYLVEGLVFQDLQAELGASVKRQVILSGEDGASLKVDGIIELPEGLLAVDVLFIRHARLIQNRFNEAIGRISIFSRSSRTPKLPKFLLAVVITDDVRQSQSAFRAIDNIRTRFAGEIQVRVFEYTELLSKYGLPPDDRP